MEYRSASCPHEASATSSRQMLLVSSSPDPVPQEDKTASNIQIHVRVYFSSTETSSLLDLSAGRSAKVVRDFSDGASALVEIVYGDLQIAVEGGRYLTVRTEGRQLGARLSCEPENRSERASSPVVLVQHQTPEANSLSSRVRRQDLKKRFFRKNQSQSGA
ncbi:MAG: hypothetical protein ACYCOU_11500 [Sulfobacillus sp.]